MIPIPANTAYHTLKLYNPLNIKNSPVNALVSGRAIFARAIMTNKMVSAGALLATPDNFEISFTPVCFSSRSATIHMPIILMPWLNICIITP